MVAQRTLTPYVRVRILLPLPNKKGHPSGCPFLFGKGVCDERPRFDPRHPKNTSRKAKDFWLVECVRGRKPVAILLPLPKRQSHHSVWLSFFCLTIVGFEPSQCHPRAVAALAASEWGHHGSPRTAVRRSNPSPAAKKLSAMAGSFSFYFRLLQERFEPSHCCPP